MSSHPALPSPPGSPSPNSLSLINNRETSDPIARLDAVLEIYLDRLDAYQTLREQLSKNFSTGFLSLANANRTSNLGSGRRYGEEGYDERMKAGGRLRIHARGEEAVEGPSQKHIENGRQSIPNSKPKTTPYMIEQFNTSKVDSDNPVRSLDPTKTTTPALSHTPDSWPPTSDSKAPDPKPKSNPKKPLNPLNWYGLLVPPALRSAQTSFTYAVEDQVPQLLNVQCEMAHLEVQIKHLREEAGLSQHNRPEADGTTDNLSTVDVKTEELHENAIDGSKSDYPTNRKDTNSPNKVKTSGTKSLSSRPKEPPRPRVLKLDT